jgi:hypothetical protein
MYLVTRHPHAAMPKRSTSPLIYVTPIVLLSVLATGCSREVPSAWTIQSPASAEAEAAPVSDVTLSLDGDPPMPGDAATGWVGLEQSTAAPDHSGHAGHAGHAEKPAQPEQRDAPPEHNEHADHSDHAKPEGAHHHGH